ncbi:hypothetical protein PF005_g32242 [Phytophthora fragariae]|uniref:Uncharacterized protein n=1 Tax=Phytophthora fragariae TaxID=53985 RepID=A0A6A4AW77_9STRA|nr:hypothetical protein PF003_g6667 [Phytophthora fragariae]KAE8955865.1 hypothetical protein PF011_g31666 [Phytophthora fragariae]KAE9056112.1 hypothetical protein PF010_g31886 [Phytophthora fragariae]KAE9058645.1 hypothetical protein PF006_g32093 [Phytophthora fragariae]KAE9058711.1 hypothetical protein PF007_g31207 [Phytophthora fragariae]
MRDFPPKARGPVLLALGGLRLCLDSGLRARPQIGKWTLSDMKSRMPVMNAYPDRIEFDEART